jgi:hypothetical protein
MQCQRCKKSLLAKSDFVALCNKAGLQIDPKTFSHIAGTSGMRDRDAIRLIRRTDDLGLVCKGCGHQYCQKCASKTGSPYLFGGQVIGVTCPNCGICLDDLE